MQSPLFQSLALVTGNATRLWLNVDKLTDEAREQLKRIEISDYKHAIDDLRKSAETMVKSAKPHKILVPDQSFYLSGASYAVYDALSPLVANTSLDLSPILKMKSIKNDVEAKGKAPLNVPE